MHYIRLLRPPSFDEKDHLKLVLTITTDLGDTFLCPKQPVPISIYAQYLKHEGPHQFQDRFKIDNGSLSWRSGLRVLKVDLRLPVQIARKVRALIAEMSKSSPTVNIIASQTDMDPPDIADIPFDTEGRILGLSVPLPRPGKEECFTATRELRTSIEGLARMLSIDEEIGESIDRHVWDAGVVATGLIFDMCKNANQTRWAKTPLLRSILDSATLERPLNVIELGCGVGILGVGLATALSVRYQHQTRNMESQEDGITPAGSGSFNSPADAIPEVLALGSILLTDLPDAEELTMANILRYNAANSVAHSGGLLLQFEGLDWEEGKIGVFGPKANLTGWDLIIISDCTYNVDMLSALVETLSALYKSSVSLTNTGPKVMLATKPRHSSEKALFDLMMASGWNILEEASQPLPSLGLEDDSLEIYLFGKTPRQGHERRHNLSPTARRRKLRGDASEMCTISDDTD